MEAILEGMRVVELAGDPAGEMLGKLLAGLGCDVVKVEPPGGSPTRAIGPFAGDHDDRLAFCLVTIGGLPQRKWRRTAGVQGRAGRQ